MAKVLGIDLGTTNSVVAVMEAGEPTVLENAEGGRLTPSVVAVNPRTGERLVGQVAKRQAITNPENTIFSVKRFMGRKFADAEVKRALEHIPYTVKAAANGDVRVVMGGKDYSPPEISAMILQKLKADAEAKLGEKITQAVRTRWFATASEPGVSEGTPSRRRARTARTSSSYWLTSGKVSTCSSAPTTTRTVVWPRGRKGSGTSIRPRSPTISSAWLSGASKLQATSARTPSG